MRVVSQSPDMLFKIGIIYNCMYQLAFSKTTVIWLPIYYFQTINWLKYNCYLIHIQLLCTNDCYQMRLLLLLELATKTYSWYIFLWVLQSRWPLTPINHPPSLGILYQILMLCSFLVWFRPKAMMKAPLSSPPNLTLSTLERSTFWYYVIFNQFKILVNELSYYLYRGTIQLARNLPLTLIWKMHFSIRSLF